MGLRGKETYKSERLGFEIRRGYSNLADLDWFVRKMCSILREFPNSISMCDAKKYEMETLKRYVFKERSCGGNLLNIDRIEPLAEEWIKSMSDWKYADSFQKSSFNAKPNRPQFYTEAKEQVLISLSFLLQNPWEKFGGDIGQMAVEEQTILKDEIMATAGKERRKTLSQEELEIDDIKLSLLRLQVIEFGNRMSQMY